MLPDDYQDACLKCNHRKTCKTPCYFVAKILNVDNTTPFYERHTKGPKNEDINVILSPPAKPCMNETNHEHFLECNSVTGKYEFTAFHSETENAFWENYKPKLNLTHVFISRFFLKKSIEEIADELGVKHSTISTTYALAKTRMLEALKYLDDNKKLLKKRNFMMKRCKKTYGELPKYQKYFLMYALFDLTIPEIAELEGANKVTVTQSMRRCVDRLRTGKLVFLDPTDKEVEKAIENIEKARFYDKKHKQKQKATA